MFTADVAAFVATVPITWTPPDGTVAAVPCYFDGTPWVEIGEDVAVVLGLAGGGPTLYERTFDTPSIQVQTRGPQMDPATAEAIAEAIDDALLIPAEPLDLGATHVISIDRMGGPPRLLQRDAARRSIFVATYIFTAARTSF